MKKQTALALVFLLLIPVVMILGGFLISLINPEIAARHPNYQRNFQLLMAAKQISFFAMLGLTAVLWLLACLMMILSKGRSPVWLFVSLLGPLGFAILATLNDASSAETDRYTRFVRSMNIFVRIGYEVLVFVILWELAYQAMVLKRNLMILYESATTGASTAQIIATQSASSGMWAFGEGLEVMYIVVLLYVLWPTLFNTVGRIATRSTPKPLASD